MAPRLGRIPSPPDSRDRHYLLTDELARRGIEVAPVGTKLWAVPVIYDQGQTEHCVGYSGAGFLSARAAQAQADAVEEFDAEALYAWANEHDGDPTAHEGSTVRSGFQALVTVGDAVTESNRADSPSGSLDKLASYLWASTVDEDDPGLDALITWLLNVGPLWVGTDWTQDMFTPASDGLVRANGGVAGGHAWLVRGVDTARGVAVGRTSWGAWGFTASLLASGEGSTIGVDNEPASDFLITLSDLAHLLSSGGECGTCVENAVEANVAAVTPPEKPAAVTTTETQESAAVEAIERVGEDVVHEAERVGEAVVDAVEHVVEDAPSDEPTAPAVG